MRVSIEYVMIEVPKGSNIGEMQKKLAFAALEYGCARMIFNDRLYEATVSSLMNNGGIRFLGVNIPVDKTDQSS